MRNKQKGMGITEVIVSIVLLTVGISALGWVQTHSGSSMSNTVAAIEATEIAQDYIETMRTNPTQLTEYYNRSTSSTAFTGGGAGIDCYSKTCTPSYKARFDAHQAYLRAKERGYNLLVSKCMPDNKVMCVYVMWEDSVQAHSTSDSNASCTYLVSNKLKIGSKGHCIFMEAF